MFLVVPLPIFSIQKKREQSKTQALDACKLFMVVDHSDVLSDINPQKKLGYDEIYQFC